MPREIAEYVLASWLSRVTGSTGFCAISRGRAAGAVRRDTVTSCVTRLSPLHDIAINSAARLCRRSSESSMPSST